MNNQTKSIVIFALFLLMMVVVIVLPKQKSGEDEPAPAAAAAPSVAVKPAPSVPAVPQEASRDAAQEQLLAESSQNIVRLQSLLDDEEKHGEALELALKMSKGNRAERAASLDTFLWIGGPKSIKALISLHRDVPEISERSSDILQHLMQQHQQETDGQGSTEDPWFALDDWFQLLNGNENDAEADAFLQMLSAFDIEIAVPVLIRLLETNDAVNQARAKEYLEFVSNGESLETVEQAKAWLEKYRQGKAESFKEKEAASTATDEPAETTPTKEK